MQCTSYEVVLPQGGIWRHPQTAIDIELNALNGVKSSAENDDFGAVTGESEINIVSLPRKTSDLWYYYTMKQRYMQNIIYYEKFSRRIIGIF